MNFVWKSIILVMFFLGGIILIWHSANLNEFLEGNFYFFEFNLIEANNNEKAVLNNFVFNYDFTEKKGKISFDLGTKTWEVTHFEIRFPSKVDNETINISIEKDNVKKEAFIKRKINHFNESLANNITRTSLEFNGFKVNSKGEKFVIEFKSENLLPNGRFYFLHQNNILNGNPSGEGNVHFVLGENYQCISNCVYDLQDIEETWRSFDRDLRLIFTENKEYHHFFKLNTLSRSTLFCKNLSLGIGISLLVSALISLILIPVQNDVNKSNPKSKKTLKKAQLKSFLIPVIIVIMVSVILVYLYPNQTISIIIPGVTIGVMLYIWFLTASFQEKSNKNQIRRERLLRNVGIYAPILDELPSTIEKLEKTEGKIEIKAIRKIYGKSPWFQIDEKFVEKFNSLDLMLMKYNLRWVGCYEICIKLFKKKLDILKKGKVKVETRGSTTVSDFNEIFSSVINSDEIKLNRLLGRNLEEDQRNEIDFIGETYIATKKEFIEKSIAAYRKFNQFNEPYDLMLTKTPILDFLYSLQRELGDAVREPWKDSL